MIIPKSFPTGSIYYFEEFDTDGRRVKYPAYIFIKISTKDKNNFCQSRVNNYIFTFKA